MMRRTILLVLTMISIISAIWFYVGQDLYGSTIESTKSKQTEMNQLTNDQKKAPNFALHRLDGTEEQLLVKGKPTLINFWASWCGPCKVEMPILQKAYEQYGDQIAFRMVNVTVEDDREHVNQLINQKKYTFPVLLDETGEGSEIYQLMSLPTTYLVDENGMIVKQVLGAMTEQQLDKMIQSLLNSSKRKE